MSFVTFLAKEMTKRKMWIAWIALVWPIPGEFGAKELEPDPVSRRRSSSTCRLDGRLLLETCSPDLWRLFRLTFFDLDNRGLSGGGKDGALQETVLRNWRLKFDKRSRPLREESLSGLPLYHISDPDLIPFFKLKNVSFKRSDSRESTTMLFTVLSSTTLSSIWLREL